MNLHHLFEAVVEGDTATAREQTERALAAGLGPLAILNQCLVPAMEEVGHLFEANEYFVPELLVSSRAMKASMALLRPLLADSGAPPAGRVVIGSVQGDLHDIGKNLVAAMLEGAGFDVLDLGADVPTERFVQAAREFDAHIVALSALLTTTMTAMGPIIAALRAANLPRPVRVMVGGAPVTQRFADSIGADAFGPSAASAPRLARDLMMF